MSIEITGAIDGPALQSIEAARRAFRVHVTESGVTLFIEDGGTGRHLGDRSQAIDTLNRLTAELAKALAAYRSSTVGLTQ